MLIGGDGIAILKIILIIFIAISVVVLLKRQWSHREGLPPGQTIYKSRKVKDYTIDASNDAGLFGPFGINLKPSMYIYMPVYYKYTNALTNARTLYDVESVISKLSVEVETVRGATSLALESQTPSPTSFIYAPFATSSQIYSFALQNLSPLFNLVPQPIRQQYYNKLLADQMKLFSLKNLLLLIAVDKSLNQETTSELRTRNLSLVRALIANLKYEMKKEDNIRGRNKSYKVLPFDPYVDIMLAGQD